jgi:hypothetical protein
MKSASNRFETSVSRLDDCVWREGLDEEASDEIVGCHSLGELLELIVVVLVVDEHRVSSADEPVLLESREATHSTSSSSIPVDTSAEHIGQVTVATGPMMKL